MKRAYTRHHFLLHFLTTIAFTIPTCGQMVDRSIAPNTVGEGIAKSLEQQIGLGRGDENTPNSSAYLIARDPFRAIRRGRQLFQRKFAHRNGAEGTFYSRDGSGNLDTNGSIGAGLADSCATCHGRPKGAAGFGAGVATRPDGRDSPHLFGLGLKEMIADEMTAELRNEQALAVAQAVAGGAAVTRPLIAKGIRFGSITARPDGTADTAHVEGVGADLRVRPFFAHGRIMSIREFVIAAMHNENGFQIKDDELTAAIAARAKVVTPSGMVLDAGADALNAPPAPDPTPVAPGQKPVNQLDTAVADYMEIYLLNEIRPAQYRLTQRVRTGRAVFEMIGCTVCHVPEFRIDRDRRLLDVETKYDPDRGSFNSLFATVVPLYREMEGRDGLPARKEPKLQPFVVKDIFTDFKLHDLGPGFWERNYDGTWRKQFITTPLWGVGSTSPYGHDGRSSNLHEVILRHGGEAQAARDIYASLGEDHQERLIAFLQSLILYPPDDTASNLSKADRFAAYYPQLQHGSIDLSKLFLDPQDPE